VFVGQAFHALQVDNEHVFDEYVAVVFSNILAFIADGKRCLRGSPDAPQAEFPKSGALVFEESRTPDMGDLQNGADHPFSERIRASAFIGVHRRLIYMCPADLDILRSDLAADEHR